MVDLYEQLCSWDNLRAAHRKAARGKRGKSPAAAFEIRLADNLLELEQELRAHTYQPGAYHSFYIHEPKRRLISAAPFRDRVVHHALMQTTWPPPCSLPSSSFYAHSPRPGGGERKYKPVSGLGSRITCSRCYKACIRWQIRCVRPAIVP